MAAPVTYASLVSESGGGRSYNQLWKVFSAELLNATASLESAISATVNGFNLEEFRYFGIWIQATPTSGTANFTITLQESFNDTAANYVAPETASAVGTVADNNAHVFVVTPTPMLRGRFKLTGIGSNPATTKITMYLFLAQ